jgi:hypothetical protein
MLCYCGRPWKCSPVRVPLVASPVGVAVGGPHGGALLGYFVFHLWGRFWGPLAGNALRGLPCRGRLFQFGMLGFEYLVFLCWDF